MLRMRLLCLCVVLCVSLPGAYPRLCDANWPRRGAVVCDDPKHCYNCKKTLENGKKYLDILCEDGDPSRPGGSHENWKCKQSWIDTFVFPQNTCRVGGERLPCYTGCWKCYKATGRKWLPYEYAYTLCQKDDPSKPAAGGEPEVLCKDSIGSKFK